MNDIEGTADSAAPSFTIEQVRQKLETTFPTATAAVKLLEELGIVAELTRQKNQPLCARHPVTAEGPGGVGSIEKAG